jgi:TolB-like protein
MGTPHYMSPEQIGGEPLDGRSDLFAVGAILFELLVGTSAFKGKTAPQVFHSILYDPLPALGGSPALAAVDRIIQRATVKRLSDRYPRAAVMADEIRAAARLADSGETPAARPVTRLIVLPFRTLRPDPEIDFLSFSLADAITASLGSLESVVVRSSLAAARFKAEAPDLAALASDLDVNVAVTGTLLRAGTEVRVATQLIEVQTGRLLWSKTTQVTLKDIFQLQDDLTREIVESLSLPLSAREQRMLSHDTPATARAYEYYLRANELASDASSWGIARDLYQQAIDEDPRYAPAWARLGSLLRRIAKLGGGTDEDMVRAEAAVARALELHPEMPLAHSLAAQLHIDSGRARDAMVRLTELATRRSTDPELFVGLVYACRYCGLLGPSLRADLRARRLDPAVKTSAGHTLFMLGQYEAVVASAVEAPAVVAFSLIALGREQDARVMLAEKDKGAAPRIRGMIRVVRTLIEGRVEEAVAGINAIAPDFRDAEGIYYLARQLAYAGAADDAMRLLERATGAGFWCHPLLASDAWLDSLRDRPDFAVVLGRAKQELELASAAFISAGGDQILGSD